MTRTWSEFAQAGNDNAVAEDDLQAYVDGQLDSRRRAAIESYLAANPRDAERLAAYRTQNIGLHALLDPRPGSPLKDDKLPPRIAALAGALQAQLSEHQPRVAVSRRLRSLAASVALLAAAGTAGWLSMSELRSPSETQIATAPQAALEPAGAATGGNAAGGQHEVVAWLAAQPGDGPTSVPRLESLGFKLTGEDVLQSDAGPAARLHYEDSSGQRVTLTMRAGDKTGQRDFTLLRDGEAPRFVWQDGQMAYSLAGGLGEDKLQRIAEAISNSLRSDQPVSAQASGETGGAAAASSSSVEPAAPAEMPTPAIEKIPLVPVPLPAADAPKET